MLEDYASVPMYDAEATAPAEGEVLLVFADGSFLRTWYESKEAFAALLAEERDSECIAVFCGADVLPAFRGTIFSASASAEPPPRPHLRLVPSL